MEIIKLKKWLLIGAALGMLGGFLYWKFVGCATGSCGITSNPYMSTLYGGIMGALLFDLKKTDKKQTEEQK